jgi:hypothetical protein
MSQDKKVVVETKLTEEEKLFEQKKAANPYIAGFIESMAKTNTEKITKESWKACLKTLVIVTVMMQRVEAKTPGSPGLPITRGSPGRAVQSGRVGPGPDVYKIGPGVLGFSFLRSTPIH